MHMAKISKWPRPQRTVQQTGGALYIRTSTVDQHGKAQLFALRRAAEARGWTSPREFVDLGHSGAKASRPALDELRRAVRAGEVRVVMVAGLDRLGRSLRDLLVLLDELTASGCAVISLRESIDLTTPVGRLMVQVIGALAEFQRSLIVESALVGIRRVQAGGKTRSGKPIGRPQRLIDLDKLRELRREGRSWRACAIALKVPARTLRSRIALLA
jgi:site-specific DNA recombinase